MKMGIPAKSFIACMSTKQGEMAIDLAASLNSAAVQDFVISKRGRYGFQLAFAPRETSMIDNLQQSEVQRFFLLLGDSSEAIEEESQCYGNLVVINCDLVQNQLTFCASMVSLPAVYLYRNAGMIIITTDIYLLAQLRGVDLRLDLKSVIDLCNIGHPDKGKTLFADVTLLPAGNQVQLSDGQIKITPFWQPPRLEKIASLGEYVEQQAENLKKAVNRLDWSNSFLSLTGGLDTRAILTLLLDQEGIRDLPACTISGPNLSLDARMAQAICGNLGLRHYVIRLDDTFLVNLPEYTQKASMLSGGLASLEQAHEVYFFNQVKDIGKSRISGHLGNQIGRRGVEKISMRNVDQQLLNPEIFNQLNVKPFGYWRTASQIGDGIPGFEFLLKEEVPYTSVGNYSIGNHFGVQQAPYAHKSLIETVFRMPRATGKQRRVSALQMRLHDLRHRFLGQSAQDSFQTKIIRDTGGFLAHYPINWGWRATGGVSLPGFILGMASLADAFASSREFYAKKTGTLLKFMHIEGLLNYVNVGDWLRINLKDFFYDMVFSKDVIESDLFHRKNVQRCADDYFSNHSTSTKEIVFILDIALAKKIFAAKCYP